MTPGAWLAERGPYLVMVVMLVTGVYVMLTHRNYLKALVGLYLLQTAIILFYVLIAVREEGTIPVQTYAGGVPMHNPLPHALMLTAIVVGVSTLGVGMAILRRMQSESGTVIEEPEPEPEDAE